MTRTPRDPNGKPLPRALVEEPGACEWVDEDTVPGVPVPTDEDVVSAVPSADELDGHLYMMSGGVYDARKGPR